jgi:hypothetical protein
MTDEMNESELESVKQEFDKAKKTTIEAILGLIKAQNPVAEGMNLDKKAEQAVDSIIELFDKYLQYTLMAEPDLEETDETDDFSIE